jgi:hypothetical protein
MPRAAVELGGVDEVLPLQGIAPAILKAANAMASAKDEPACRSHAAISAAAS